MNNIAKAIALSATLIAGSGAAQAAPADTNVAFNKAVTLSGTFYDNPAGWTGSNGAAPASITDGIFTANQQQWNVGTVWWNTGYTNNYIQIDLGGLFNINRLTLQADNNDTYRVSYLDQANSWVNLIDMNPPDAWGMTTVTNTLPQSILARGFRISDGPSGDCCNSVSEFQAFGVAAVPEPETYGMLLAGAGIMGAILRRRRIV